MITKEQREHLIKIWPNCGFDCPEGKEFQCSCNKCVVNNGFWEPNEMESLFNSDDVELIKKLFGKRGYLGEHGCLLAPAYRPGVCLKADCRLDSRRAR